MRIYHNIELRDLCPVDIWSFATKLEAERAAEKWLRKEIRSLVEKNKMIELNKSYDSMRVDYDERWLKADLKRLRQDIGDDDIRHLIDVYDSATYGFGNLLLSHSEIEYDDVAKNSRRYRSGAMLHHNVQLNMGDYPMVVDVITSSGEEASLKRIRLWLLDKLQSGLHNTIKDEIISALPIPMGGVDRKQGMKCSPGEIEDMIASIDDPKIKTWDVVHQFLDNTEEFINYSRLVSFVKVGKLKLGCLE